MKNPFKKSGYYSFDDMVKKYPDATYYMAISERGNGKTYDILKRFLKDYCEHGYQQAYIRRFDEDFIGKRGDMLCNGLVRDGLVEKYSGGEWTGIYHRGTNFYLCKTEIAKKKNGDIEEKRVICQEPWLYGFSLSAMEHDKGASYDRTHAAALDEFLTRSFYLRDEFVLFSNVLSTLIRDKTDFKIFMAGNTVSKVACPYFREMGLDRVKTQEQGTIDVYNYGDTGLQVAVEYCASRKKSKESSRYFAFGNPHLQMITNGRWEVSPHPHLPVKYLPKEVVFVFYLQFDGDLFQCNIIQHDGLFIFIHPKTTDLKDDNDVLIYSDAYDPRPNWHRSVYRGTTRVDGIIRQLFANGRVYYSDNMTGEYVDAYLKWARSNS